ncbi:MAG TPA: helix-turn-helix domain-containing protein [Rhizomicrobium sp.]|nr:helix-turn-helix domain-containing protein [Rhizomicrobium sp.]
MKPVRRRRRRSADEARSEALVSARNLLLKHGPEGVTLMAVAEDLGMTHGNLIHHFGSADELQTALMVAMVHDLTEAIGKAVGRVRSDESSARLLVDAVFDAFDQGGAGMLAAWMALSQRQSHLEPIRAAVAELVDAIDKKSGPSADDRPRRIQSAILIMTLCAFGDAVIGPQLREMLGRDSDSVRRVATRLLPTFF